MAIGNPKVPAGTTDYSIGLEVTQRSHVEGLPLGTRGGALVQHVFPADGEYDFFARLNRTILNGYAGVEGWEKPHEFVILIDGEQVFSARWAVPRTTRPASKDAIDIMPRSKSA